VCEQLAEGCYLKAERPRFEPATFCVAIQTQTTTPPSHNWPHYRQLLNYLTMYTLRVADAVRGHTAAATYLLNKLWLSPDIPDDS